MGVLVRIHNYIMVSNQIAVKVTLEDEHFDYGISV